MYFEFCNSFCARIKPYHLRIMQSKGNLHPQPERLSVRNVVLAQLEKSFASSCEMGQHFPVVMAVAASVKQALTAKEDTHNPHLRDRTTLIHVRELSFGDLW